MKLKNRIRQALVLAVTSTLVVPGHAIAADESEQRGTDTVAPPAKESAETQPGTDIVTPPAAESTEAQPGTDTSKPSENESTQAQPGTDTTTPPASESEETQPGAAGNSGNGNGNAQPGTEARVTPSQPVESTTTVVVPEQDVIPSVTPTESVAKEPTPVPETTVPTPNTPPVVDEAPEDEEETAPVREESPRETYMAPQAAAPVAAPAVQPAPAPVPAPVPVVTDEVVGAELTARVGDVTVTAQGTAQPFDGTVSVDSPIGRAEYALPAKEVAAAQQVGQAVAGTLPPEQKAVVDDVHNAAIEFVEGLPQHQVGAVGGVTYDATFEHAVEYH